MWFTTPDITWTSLRYVLSCGWLWHSTLALSRACRPSFRIPKPARGSSAEGVCQMARLGTPRHPPTPAPLPSSRCTIQHQKIHHRMVYILEISFIGSRKAKILDRYVYIDYIDGSCWCFEVPPVLPIVSSNLRVSCRHRLSEAPHEPQPGPAAKIAGKAAPADSYGMLWKTTNLNR